MSVKLGLNIHCSPLLDVLLGQQSIKPERSFSHEPSSTKYLFCLTSYMCSSHILLTRSMPYAGFRLACRLPLCRCAAWSSLAVSELQVSAATPLWLYHRAASLPSWIEFNCLRSAAVGKAARLSIYWLDAACRLVIPLRQVKLAQLK